MIIKKTELVDKESGGKMFTRIGVRFERDMMYYRARLSFPDKQETVVLQSCFVKDEQVFAPNADEYRDVDEIVFEMSCRTPVNGGSVIVSVGVNIPGSDSPLKFSDEIYIRGASEIMLVDVQAEPGGPDENDVFIDQSGNKVQDLFIGTKAVIKVRQEYRIKEIADCVLSLRHERIPESIRHCAPLKRRKTVIDEQTASVEFPVEWKNRIPVGQLGGEEADVTLHLSFSALLECTEENKSEKGCREIHWDSQKLELKKPLKVVRLTWTDDLC